MHLGRVKALFWSDDSQQQRSTLPSLVSYFPVPEVRGFYRKRFALQPCGAQPRLSSTAPILPRRPLPDSCYSPCHAYPLLPGPPLWPGAKIMPVNAAAESQTGKMEVIGNLARGEAAQAAHSPPEHPQPHPDAAGSRSPRQQGSSEVKRLDVPFEALDKSVFSCCSHAGIQGRHRKLPSSSATHPTSTPVAMSPSVGSHPLRSIRVQREPSPAAPPVVPAPSTAAALAAAQPAGQRFAYVTLLTK